MSLVVKEWPFGLSYDDLEEKLEEQGLKWSEDKKLDLWRNLCKRSEYIVDMCYEVMQDAIDEEEEE